jgi:predicted DsbA family dithiol-disulfide isomerase
MKRTLMTLLNIEVYSDLICPWCYIGRRRLEAGINIGKNEVLAKVAADAGLSEKDAKRFLESDQGATKSWKRNKKAVAVV